MKKKLLLAAVSLLVVLGSAMARPVDADKARRVGAAYMQAMDAKGAASLEAVATEFSRFYVFASAEGGFVIVSADDCVVPILGWSATSTFEAGELPENVRHWLEGYDSEIGRLQRLEADSRGLHGRGNTARVDEQWQVLLGGGRPAMPLATSVSPLIATTWNQSPYYNVLCPYDNSYNERTVTGCVATATAQIMKFWNHPATGYGSHSYTGDYGTLSAGFGSTSYDWQNMPAALSSASSQTQVNAVSTLMYHIGVAVEMSYGVSATGGSGAHNYNYYGTLVPSSQTALMRYFKYRPDMSVIARADYDDDAYCAYLRAELDANRPILYSGRHTSGGHSFVCDGYNEQGQFHFNWGWGGARDGYFVMGSLNPGTGGIGGNGSGTYNMDNVVVLGIRPSTAWNTDSTTTVAVGTSGGDAGCTASGAGSYSFGSTVQLLASASEGYRFSRWSDGSRFNPREFVATGGSYTFTACYEPVGTDTVTYCSGGYVHNSYGTGSGSTTWGIKLPAVAVAGKVLQSVMVYAPDAGTYNLNVYDGTVAPVNTLATASATATEEGWLTVQIAVPTMMPAGSNLWIAFESSDVAYPAAFTSYGGRADGLLWGSSLQQMGANRTFMIKGVFSTPAAPTVNIVGQTQVATGLPATFTAQGTDSSSVAWSFQGGTPQSASGYTASTTWSTPGTYRVGATIANANGTGRDSVDVLAVDYTASDTVSYCLGRDMMTNVGAGNGASLSWGIMLPSPFLADRHQIESILIGAGEVGTYSVSIYSGGTTVPQTLVHSDTLTVSAADTASVYTVYTPDAPIAINRQQNLWVVVHTTGLDYPARSCAGTIDSNADWTNIGSEWRHLHELGITGSWLIKVVTSSYVPPTTYTLTVLSNDSTMGTVSGGGTYTAGSVVNITATPAAGHHFEQWSDGDTMAVRSITVNSDTTFTARFAADPVVPSYTLTVLSNDTTMGTVSGGGTYTAGSVVNITATPAAGHHFEQWSDGDTMAVRSITVNSDTTFTARFAADPVVPSYTLTVLSNDTTMGTVSGGGTYTAGSVVNITATPAAGHHFEQWSDGDTMAVRSITVNSDTTFTARFAADPVVPSYTLTVLSNDTTMGTVSGGGTYTAGSIVSISATPKEGYRFVAWNDGNTSVQRFIAILEDITYIATFEPLQQPAQRYTVTVVSANAAMGTVDGGGTYDEGETITISATANDGYRFASWSDGDTNSSRAIVVVEDATYIATFEALPEVPQYTVLVLSTNNTLGTVSGSGTYSEGSEVDIMATPLDGAHFVAWHDGDTNAERTITVDADALYIAIFAGGPAPVRYMVSVGIDGESVNAEVSGSGSYLEGSEATVTATPHHGWSFAYWTINGDTANTVTANPYTFTVAADMVLTAHFEPWRNAIDAAEGMAIALMPNPASATVRVSGIEAGTTVEMIDASGRSCGVWTASGDGISIDVSATAAGLYFVKVARQGTVKIEKLIIKH